MTNEAFARIKIDQLLKDTDWRLTDGISVRYEYPLDDGGRADYALFNRQGRALAVLEAKSTSVSLSAGEAQGWRYADLLDVPFIFLSNGEEIWFCDKGQDAHFRRIETVFSQDDLARRKAARDIRRSPLDIPIDSRIAGGGGRLHQSACIEAVCREIVNGRRKMLVEMAIGTGKTRTAAALLKRLFEANWATRALFVVDRNTLAIQAEDAFAEHLPHLPCYRVPRTGRRFQDEKRVTIVTLQTLVNEYEKYSSGYFELIIIDECHHSIYGQWRRALDHFDGIKVGLTATPCVMQDTPDVDDEDRAAIRDTLRFFEVSRPTYSYSMSEAIADGHLVPYEIYRAMTAYTAATDGFSVARSDLDWAALDAPTREELERLFADRDPIIVDPSALERKFTIPERKRAMVRGLRGERYDDGGYSGGSMERPALQKLLADVAEQRLDYSMKMKSFGGGGMIGRVSENMDDQAGAYAKSATSHKAIRSLSFAALGIVFGDIGTSPLYTMKTVLSATGDHVDRGTALGVLSLLAWTLVIVTSIKYVLFAMRIDNDGEGGILALMSLIGIKRGHRPAIVAAGLFGAALIYGDGAITPAISVLSALEGLHLAIPAVDSFVLPAAIVVLVGLFALQRRGTSSIGKLFGPVMLTWFVVVALMGVYGIAQNPSVLVGLSPTYAVEYLVHGGFTAFALLGGVFLCVTGAEALYADMGHFGKRPIWLAWFAIVFPALILNYAGQAAIVLNGAPTQDNIFYRLCPPVLLVPLILLATVATVIASQSIITGAFSMTRQAIQLGWMPRLLIKQTSDEGYGQIYVGAVNWLLMIVTIGLTLGFRKSDNLASAYGIAVSATMLMTSALLYIAMREVWGWSVALAGAVAAAFLIVDGTFFASNLLKLMDGGWVPLVLAIGVYSVMRVWHSGIAAVTKVLGVASQPIGAFFDGIEADKVVRVPGTAVFLSREQVATPPLLIWHVRQNACLYENVLIINVVTALVPRVTADLRFKVEQERATVWRVVIHNGFMERLSLDELLPVLRDMGCAFDSTKVVYYVGHETIVRAREGKRLLGTLTERIFAAMERNQAHLIDVLGLPSDQVIDIGRHIEL